MNAMQIIPSLALILQTSLVPSTSLDTQTLQSRLLNQTPIIQSRQPLETAINSDLNTIFKLEQRVFQELSQQQVQQTSQRTTGTNPFQPGFVQSTPLAPNALLNLYNNTQNPFNNTQNLPSATQSILTYIQNLIKSIPNLNTTTSTFNLLSQNLWNNIWNNVWSRYYPTQTTQNTEDSWNFQNTKDDTYTRAVEPISDESWVA